MGEWDDCIKGFHDYLLMERSLSFNTLEAYERDIRRFVAYLQSHELNIGPRDVHEDLFPGYFTWLSTEERLEARTEARMISGMKSFFKYLQIEGMMEANPTRNLETPRLSRTLPDVLSIDEIDRLLASIDLSTNEGQRNKAMVETLYSCGLRVSELVNLKLSNLRFAEGYIKVEGKGNKERLVPISTRAIKEIRIYISNYRSALDIDKKNEDVVFLNRNGKQLTRVMVFTVVKRMAKNIGLQKTISPHTFRHSFASHLVDGGADLRAVQDMLGHESITTTEIYTHLDKQYLHDTIMLYHPRAKV